MISVLVVAALLVIVGVVLNWTARRSDASFDRLRARPCDDRDWARIRDELRAAAQRSRSVPAKASSTS